MIDSRNVRRQLNTQDSAVVETQKPPTVTNEGTSSLVPDRQIELQDCSITLPVITPNRRSIWLVEKQGSLHYQIGEKAVLASKFKALHANFDNKYVV